MKITPYKVDDKVPKLWSDEKKGEEEEEEERQRRLSFMPLFLSRLPRFSFRAPEFLSQFIAYVGKGPSIFFPILSKAWPLLFFICCMDKISMRPFEKSKV